jgi:hypothetical protein
LANCSSRNLDSFYLITWHIQSTIIPQWNFVFVLVNFTNFTDMKTALTKYVDLRFLDYLAFVP